MSPYKYITLTDPVGSSTAPLGIGDEGQVIGFYRDGNGDAHGFLYSGGSYTAIDDPLGVGGTIATGINNNGQIVGYYASYPNLAGEHGFVDSGGSFTTLPDPSPGNGAFAQGINDNGQIVGYYGDSTGAHGFVYSDGIYTTINDPSGFGILTLRA
jgi:probable HAF family extracellular repeat protein